MEPHPQSSPAERNPLLFIKEVAKYFMDFLETDFHRQRAPRRTVRFKDPNSLLVGVNIQKYSTYIAKVWYLINRGFRKSLVNEIAKGAYRAEIPRGLLELVRLQTEKISDDQILVVVSSVIEEIERVAVSHAKEYDRALIISTEAAVRAIQKDLVFPLISSLERPLQNLELGDENRVYLMQEELTAVLLELLTTKISELLRLAISREEVDKERELSSCFELSEVKSKIFAFFESYKVGDLFLEIFEMERNRNILDKQELYLYFCDITYDNNKYPIFYIPFAATVKEDVVVTEFDAQVYINKRALDYIVQEINKLEDRRGALQCCAERIIYLAQHEADFGTVISAALQELINVLQLDGSIDISRTERQQAKSNLVRISNACYFSLFDKADEALVNDYEEILRLLALGNDNPLAIAFQKLIDDFINRDPVSFTTSVGDEWDDSSPTERLVFDSPIPLNSEQRQILSALNKDGCRYITVEGPPGTGKSHTITAVVFDAIQKDQSVLVLSDKKEALDVVEDKITKTMDRVRFDKHFQNPILRLGRTGSTYSEILSTASIENIRTHFRAVKKEYESVAEDIAKRTNSLKEDIEAEIVSYSDVDIREVQELVELENIQRQTVLPLDAAEFLAQSDGAIHFEELRSFCSRLVEIFGPPTNRQDEMAKVLATLGWTIPGQAHCSIEETLDRAESVMGIVEKLHNLSANSLEAIGLFGQFSGSQLPTLQITIKRYDDCRSSLFGYLFKRRQVEEIDGSARTAFRLTSAEQPHKLLSSFREASSTFASISILCGDGNGHGKSFDTLAAVHQCLVHRGLRPFLEALSSLKSDCAYLRNEVFPRYPETFSRANIDPHSTASILNSPLARLGQAESDKLVRQFSLYHKIQKAFASVPSVHYGDQQAEIEDLVTVQMAHAMDGRVIEFYENNRATAKTLRDIIRTKRQFPREEFGKLKKAFPCILAGIRDYAEYIPLETEIFDLLIIDEASQVSVSQAFPALLRSKRVLILGDKKQFSNVKAAQARSDTNREYVNQLREVFVRNISGEDAKLVRLEKFNIKCSILDFFELITNYQTQLCKYFRGYKEIISFSNEKFYRHSLQVMKIRGKPIDEVLRFSFVPHDGKSELLTNTNTPEAEFIVSELRKLKESNSRASVGIITPHTNQQKLLIETINKMQERAYLFDDLRLKIMTFDTCQGEERDIIFYSMVANPASDRLWGIFIKDLKNVMVEEEGQIKAQRLNVGLSRAKECMHFVLSKGLKDFTGSIGEALRHYEYTLQEAKKERKAAEVDKNSGMEASVLNWFYQTQFWRDNKSKVEIIPQFEIGQYLKQLDKTYEHPMYRVDFLLIFRQGGTSDRKIIMEYDGFLEHFTDRAGITKQNYAEYYSPEHVYRQKVLEGYGYRFLRINRFNMGSNPIETLNRRLIEVSASTEPHNHTMESIHSAVASIQNGQLKECPKCKELRPLAEFKDSTLTSGFGRFCSTCKTAPVQQRQPSTKKRPPRPAAAESELKFCTKCGSRMELRRGRYGKFWGCSRYPYCKGTARA